MTYIQDYIVLFSGHQRVEHSAEKKYVICMAEGFVASSIASDEAADFSCSPCAETGRIRQAVKYCVQCQDYYCQACTDNHASFPALRRHTLLDKTYSVSSGRQTVLPSVPTERCKVHQTKIIDMYCPTHDDVGCTTCMALEHRLCFDVQSIPDVIARTKTTREDRRIRESLKTSKTTMENIKILTGKDLKDVQKSRQNAIGGIKGFRKDLEDLLAKLEKVSIQEVSSHFDDLESGLKKKHQEISDRIEDLEDAISKLEQMDGNRSQQFVTLKSAEKALKMADVFSKSTPLSDDKRIKGYCINADIKKAIEHFNSFGQIKYLETDSKIERREDAVLYSLQKSIAIYVGMESDGFPCEIVGSCFTSDGNLLLTDSLNVRLKLVDVSGQRVRGYCDLPAVPCGVCCTRPQEAVVCLVDNTVQLVSLGTYFRNSMKLSKQLKFDHNCYGVAFKDDKLFISDNRQTVYVHDMTGKILNTIPCNSKRKIRDVTYEPCTDSLYVAAWDCVLVYDRQGKHSSTFRDQRIEGINGVCADNSGSVFVCGYKTDNVLQLARACQITGEILTRQNVVLKDIYSVSSSPDKTKLCVTADGSLIKVFELRG